MDSLPAAVVSELRAAFDAYDLDGNPSSTGPRLGLMAFDETNTTIETTFYEQLHNVSVYMNVIGFQKSASSITLHGGFNGQSLFVNGDYASYTVGGKTYDVKVEAEADSRRRLDDHHARVGGERRFLFENTEAMHEYHDEMHRIVGTFEVGVVFCCV